MEQRQRRSRPTARRQVTTAFQRILHAIFSHPGHEHYYSLHVERDEQGNVRPYWKCMFFFCGEELEVTEWE